MELYDSKIFARNLTQLLEINGVSQREIARKLSVSSSTVSSWCTGTKLPRMDKVQALANLFDVSISDLIEKPTPVSESGLDSPKAQKLIEMVKQMDDTQLDALEAILDSVIRLRGQ